MPKSSVDPKKSPFHKKEQSKVQLKSQGSNLPFFSAVAANQAVVVRFPMKAPSNVVTKGLQSLLPPEEEKGESSSYSSSHDDPQSDQFFFIPVFTA